MTVSEKLMKLFSEFTLYWFKELSDGKIEVRVKNEELKVFESFCSLENYIKNLTN